MHVGHHRIMAFAGWTSVDLSSRSACGQFLDIVCTRKNSNSRRLGDTTVGGRCCWKAWRPPSLVFMLQGAKCPRFQVLCIDGNNATLLPETVSFTVHEVRSSWSPAHSRHLIRLTPAFWITGPLITGTLTLVRIGYKSANLCTGK
jgi:hypothetical protein